MDHEVCHAHGELAADMRHVKALTEKIDATLASHCNGGGQHVTRREHDTLKAAVDGMVTSVRDVAETVTGLQGAADVSKARSDRSTMIMVAVIGLAGVVAQAVMNLLGR
jgi:hypothetical protein